MREGDSFSHRAGKINTFCLAALLPSGSKNTEVNSEFFNIVFLKKWVDVYLVAKL